MKELKQIVEKRISRSGKFKLLESSSSSSSSSSRKGKLQYMLDGEFTSGTGVPSSINRDFPMENNSVLNTPCSVKLQ